MRSYCPEIFVHLGSTYAPPPPQDPPNMKKVYFFSYFGFKLSYQIASLFHMYIAMVRG